MKTIEHNSGLLHVETPLGIVNIHVGLTDLCGRKVDSIVVIPDEPKVVRRGYCNTRLVQLKTKKKGAS